MSVLLNLAETEKARHLKTAAMTCIVDLSQVDRECKCWGKEQEEGVEGGGGGATTYQDSHHDVYSRTWDRRIPFFTSARKFDPELVI